MLDAKQQRCITCERWAIPGEFFEELPDGRGVCMASLRLSQEACIGLEAGGVASWSESPELTGEFKVCQADESCKHWRCSLAATVAAVPQMAAFIGRLGSPECEGESDESGRE